MVSLRFGCHSSIKLDDLAQGMRPIARFGRSSRNMCGKSQSRAKTGKIILRYIIHLVKSIIYWLLRHVSAIIIAKDKNLRRTSEGWLRGWPARTKSDSCPCQVAGISADHLGVGSGTGVRVEKATPTPRSICPTP